MKHICSESKSPASDNALALTAAQLAALLNVSLRHIRRLEILNALPRSVKIGRCRRYPVESVRQWLADGCPRQHRKVIKTDKVTR